MSNQTAGKEDKNILLYQILAWIVTLLVPVTLVLTAIRLLMFPVFLQIEYRMPGFPPDPYGFTLEDRLYWSRFAMDYLTNSEDISYLGDLRFENGSPVFNERELKHMVDVQIALNTTINVWYLTLGIMLVLGVWAWRGDWWNIFRAGLARGGWLTIFVIAGLILIVLLSFGIFFVAFHNVFFEPGTWVFYFSDTLIRLFPERFWRDIFIYVGLFALAGGAALAFGLRNKS
jgi:integral membrane protein (TIGR01906 family)